MNRLQLTVAVHAVVLDFFFSSRRRHRRCSRDWSSDVCSSDLTTDANGHGTWVSGIVAARVNQAQATGGVDYNLVQVLPVTVLGADGTGYDGDIIAGVVYAVDHGASVILMAFSASGYSDSLQDAIDYAWSNNVVVVAAAGNDGSNTAT